MFTPNLLALYLIFNLVNSIGDSLFNSWFNL